LGQLDWLADPRFANPDSRRLHSAAMQEALAAVIALRDAGEWEQLLSTAGIPCGVIRDIEAAMSLPDLQQRALRIPVHVPGLPQGEDVAVLGPGFISAHGSVTELDAPPRHGQHTDEILAALGCSRAAMRD
jgi:crotonobetainyl-CoA:carnitine CoA-transferase CaiB-like acyl-CoA transferase